MGKNQLLIEKKVDKVVVGESTLRDFRPSCMNHGKERVIGHLTPVEYNRLTVSDTVSIDEPAGGYMEIVEYRISARGHLNFPKKISLFPSPTSHKHQLYGARVEVRDLRKYFVSQAAYCIRNRAACLSRAVCLFLSGAASLKSFQKSRRASYVFS